MTGSVSYVESGVHRGKYLDKEIRYVFFSSLDYLGDLLAAVYRSYGYDAVSAPPVSQKITAWANRTARARNACPTS